MLLNGMSGPGADGLIFQRGNHPKCIIILPYRKFESLLTRPLRLVLRGNKWILLMNILERTLQDFFFSFSKCFHSDMALNSTGYHHVRGVLLLNAFVCAYDCVGW